MPTRKKQLRIYALYDGPSGPTAQSVYYGKLSKTTYHVAAYSVKQAILLAARREWSRGGQPGLVELGRGSEGWTREDGTHAWGPTFRHRDRFPPS